MNISSKKPNPDDDGYFYLYHYTKAEFLEDILTNRHLKVTIVGHSNDPLETLPSFDIDNIKDSDEKIDILKFKSLWRNLVRDSIHAAVCMSSSCSSLLMWSHYAEAHKGVCLVFRFKNLIEATEAHSLFPIRYSKSRIKLKNYVIKTSDTNLLVFEKLMADLIGVKPLDWSYEHEFRFLIKDSDTLEYHDGAFYTNFLSNNLYGVILGVRCPLSMEQATAICKSVKYRSDEGAKSSDIVISRAHLSEKRHAIRCKPFKDLPDKLYESLTSQFGILIDWNTKKQYQCLDLKTGSFTDTKIDRIQLNDLMEKDKKEITIGELFDPSTVATWIYWTDSFRINNVTYSSNSSSYVQYLYSHSSQP